MNIFCKVSQSCKVEPEDGFPPEILKEGTPVYMIEIIDRLCAIRYLSKSGWKVGHAERRYITPTTSCKTRFYSVSQLDKNKWQAMTWFEGAVEPYYMHSYSAESAAKNMEFEMMARGIEDPKCTAVIPLSIQRADCAADVCPSCKGTGADPMSDNTNWLPCQKCAGKRR